MKSTYSITAHCYYFGFPRSSYYLWVDPGRPLYKAFNQDLVKPITEIFTEQPKGDRYVCSQLRRHYNIIRNNKTIYRYMRILGLKSPIRQKKYHYCTQREINEKARHVHYNVLAQNFKASRPLEKCVADVSFVNHNHGRDVFKCH